MTLIEQIEEAINDWYSIIDYEDKEQMAWCRRNITELKIKLRQERSKHNKS